MVWNVSSQSAQGLTACQRAPLALMFSRAPNAARLLYITPKDAAGKHELVVYRCWSCASA